jgi:hypothetical protein
MSKTQPLHTSDKLKIHKLSQTQFQRESEAGNLDPSALYVTPEESLIIKLNGGNTEGVDKFTYDGSHQKTINISLGSESPLGHSHDLYIGGTQESAEYAITKEGGVYELTAGGASCYIQFPDCRQVLSTQLTTSSSSGTYPLLLHYPTSATSSTNPTARCSGLYLNYKNTNGVAPTLNVPGELDVLGQINCSSIDVTSGVSCSTLRAQGVEVSDTISSPKFIATSDRRLKENLVPYSPATSILDLPVYTFNFIADPEKNTHLGCMAQDLQKICPELVYTKQDGYLGIEENKLVYLLLDEVKKLKAELSELKATLEK